MHLLLKTKYLKQTVKKVTEKAVKATKAKIFPVTIDFPLP